MKKEMYLSPRTDVLSLGYAEPVCMTVSGEIPDYEVNPLTPGDLFGSTI